MRPLIITLLAGLLLAHPALATNNYFLPGDAFFSIALSQQEIEKWAATKEDDYTFYYERLDGTFFACGNIGYTALAMDGISPEMRLSLAEAYWRYAALTRPLYREEGDKGKSLLIQVNSVVALVYHKSFDLQHNLGLKFNEDWVLQGGGHHAGFLTSARAVTHDWRDAAHVAPLAVREKLDPQAHFAAGYETARAINEPLHISSDDVQIILVGFADQNSAEAQWCPGLQAIFDQENGARYMIVTRGLIRDFECDEDGAWGETKVKVPLEPVINFEKRCTKLKLQAIRLGWSLQPTSQEQPTPVMSATRNGNFASPTCC